LQGPGRLPHCGPAVFTIPRDLEWQDQLKIKFKSNFLKKEDFPEPKTLTITGVELREIGFEGQKEEKYVLVFEGLEQGLVLNRQNSDTLVELFGSDDSDDWIGKKITLFHDPHVTFKGRRVGGLRLREAE